MHCSKTLVLSFVGRVKLKYFDKSVVIIVAARMDWNRAWLIDSNKVVIFEDDFWNSRNNWCFLSVGFVDHFVIVFQLVTTADYFVVNIYATIIDCFAVVVIGISLEFFCEHLKQCLADPSSLCESSEHMFVFVDEAQVTIKGVNLLFICLFNFSFWRPFTIFEYFLR